MRNLTVGMCLVLAACASTSKVVPDTYTAASHATKGWSSGPEQVAKAVEEADAYCERHGKQVDVVSESDSGPGGFGKTSSGEVHFRCLAPAGK